MVMSGFFALIGVIRFLRAGTVSRPAVFLFTFFFALAWLRPAWLAIPRRAWMALGSALGRIHHPLVLAVLFYGVLTPVGFIRRWRGHSKFDDQPGAPPRWIPIERAQSNFEWEKLKRQF